MHNSQHWLQHKTHLSPNQFFKLVSDLPHIIWLDSGSHAVRGEFDIITAAPSKRLYNETDSFESQTIPQQYAHLPFVCGEMGFLSYDLGEDTLLKFTSDIERSESLTLFRAYYSWSYCYDRKINQGYITFSPTCDPRVSAQIISSVDMHTADEVTPQDMTASLGHTLHWSKSQTKAQYMAQFKRAIDYIYAGDCYQINLTQRFESHFAGNAADLYCHLRQRVDTPYSVFMQLDKDQAILSFSPEQFIGINNRKAVTRPIKGTIANTKDITAHTLSTSEKNQAENVMIVDLLRNDLSKVSKAHTVKTEALFELETYKNVHHLVSKISSELKDDINELEAFLSCFPGGSITGAPKKRAMEIIQELEHHSRSAYCGSVYYLNDNGRFDSNILIRTIMKRGKKLYCWGGGAIVADSDADEEYNESITKVRNLFDVLDD